MSQPISQIDVDDEGQMEESCDECGSELSTDAYAGGEGLCDLCNAIRFICSECGERTLKTDAHDDPDTMCWACGEAKDAEEDAEAAEEEAQQAIDDAAEALQDQVDYMIEAGNLEQLKDALRALKRLYQD